MTTPPIASLDRLRELSRTPGLLFADDATTYVPGTMVLLLFVNRFPSALRMEDTGNPRWDTQTALNELLGTVEGTITVYKWARSWAPVPSGTTYNPAPVELGLLTLSVMSSAICVEKALKTLLAIEHPDRPLPHAHHLKDLWEALSADTRQEVEVQRDTLPPCWQSPPDRGHRNIPSILATADSAFIWGRYVPEMRGRSHSTIDPLVLMQVVVAIVLVCVGREGVATHLPLTDNHL